MITINNKKDFFREEAMEKGKILLLFLLVLFLAYFFQSFAFAQLPTEDFNTIRITGEGTIDTKGNLHLDLNWKIPTNSLYIEIKRNYPNPYVILREFASQRATFEVVNATIEYDDAQRQLHLKTDFLGASVNKKGRWEMDVGEGADCIFMEEQRAMFLEIIPGDSQMIQVMDMMINLPQEASNIRYNEEKGVLAYSLPEKPASGYCELELLLKSKPRLMAATYKVYGNPDISEGSMWVAKAIFKNSGESNIHNLKISYKLGEYSDWSVPQSYSLIVPGGYAVDLYYPVISSKITQLLSRTPVDVQIKYDYEDEKRNTYSDHTGERIEILGVNQIEFCNLTMQEITGTWTEYFSNSPMLAAWVTHLDSPVKALAGMVSRLAGGVPSGLDQESAIKFCKALYDLEVANGVAYQTPSGFLVEHLLGQDVKYPRDVLRDKSGTCVDLAILYASVCEAVGLESILVLIPGHCFPVIILPGGGLLPVECTSISGAAVGAPQAQALSFDKSVEFASKELSELQVGKYYMVNVQQMQNQGVVSPELVKLENDILERWGWRLPPTQVQTQTQQAPADVPVEKRSEAGKTSTTATMQQYSSEQLKFSFTYPSDWKIREEQEAVNVNDPQNLAWVTIFRAQNEPPQDLLQNTETQLKQKWQNYTVISRSEVKINSIDALRVDGEATSEGNVWVFTLLVLYQNNAAKLMVGSGAIKQQYAVFSPFLQQIFNSINLLDEKRTQTTPSQTSQQTQQPTETTERPEERTTTPTSQTSQASGNGSEGIKILQDSARGADPLPLTQRTPPSDWIHLAHPTVYTLKLIRPPDWKEEIMQDPSGYYGGLRIISPDHQANLFVYYGTTFEKMGINEGIKEGINLLVGSYPPVEIIVEDNLRQVVSAIWPGAECRFVAFRYQEKVGILLCITCPMGGGATSIQLKGCLGAASEFDSLVKEVFYKVFGWTGAGGYTTPVPRG